MVDLILQVLAVGLVGGGLAFMGRAAPWPAAWKKKKPLSCIACMSLHGAWVTTVGMAALGWLPFDFLRLCATIFGASLVSGWLLGGTGVFNAAIDLFAPPLDEK